MQKISKNTLKRMMVAAIVEVKNLCADASPTKQERENLKKNLVAFILSKQHQRTFTLTVDNWPVRELRIVLEQSFDTMPRFSPGTFVQIIIDFDEQKVLLKKNASRPAHVLYENKVPVMG